MRYNYGAILDFNPMSIINASEYFESERKYILNILGEIEEKQKLIQNEFDIFNGSIIGRDPNQADIAIDYDKAISRSHAKIFKDKNGNIMLEDLGSSNGTIIDDGDPINPNEPITIQNENRLLLGETTFIFYTS